MPKQPASANSEIRRLERTPDRSIECRNLLNALDGEQQGAPGFLAPVVDGRTISFDPRDDTAVANTLQTNERVVAKGETPTRWCSNVDTKKLAVNARDGVVFRGHRDAAECGPQHRWWRNEPAR